MSQKYKRIYNINKLPLSAFAERGKKIFVKLRLITSSS